MIHGLLIGILLAAAATFFSNPSVPASFLTDNAALNGTRSMIRMVAWNIFVIALCTMIGLLIRGS